MDIAFLGAALLTWWSPQFLLVIETISYPGFVQFHTRINVIWLVTVLVTIFFLICQLKFVKSKRKMINQILVLQFIASTAVTFIYVIARFLDKMFYDNFFFSRTHINLVSLEHQVYFSVLIFVILLITHRVHRLPHLNNKMRKGLQVKFLLKSLIEVGFIIMLMTFCLQNGLTTFSSILGQLAAVVRNMHTTKLDREMMTYGGKESAGWIYPYTQFINKHVPENGIIFIPPQMESWQMEGNPYFLRWFIYPRNTIHSETMHDPVPAEAEYILIAWGSWKFNVKEYGWPKIRISKEKIESITFIDRNTGREEVVHNTDFIPKDYEQWGIIQLRK